MLILMYFPLSSKATSIQKSNPYDDYTPLYLSSRCRLSIKHTVGPGQLLKGWSMPAVCSLMSRREKAAELS